MDERRARKRAALALMKGMDADFSMMISFMKNLADVSQQAIWLFLEREASQERGEKVCPIDKTNDDPKHLCRLVEKVPRVGRRSG